MNMINQIFFTDQKNLWKNPFCLVIVVGACFLAALYAWANIFSNWDPYGNTGNLKMAAVSLDKGYTTDEGEYENAGDELIKELHDNDKIDWQFVETADEAIEGVTDGTYYGAIVVSEDFTYDMYNVFLEDVHKPILTFYQNQKINPVATKISDTVVETIQNNINEKFVQTMTTTVFADANDLSDEIEKDGGIDGLIDKLKKIRDELDSYVDTIDAAMAGNEVLSRASGTASSDTQHMKQQSEKAGQSLHDAAESLSKSQGTLNSYFDKVNNTVDGIEKTLDDMQKTLEKGTLSGDINKMADAVQQCIKDTNDLTSELDALDQAMYSEVSQKYKDTKKDVDEKKEAANDAVKTAEEKEKEYKELVAGYVPEDLKNKSKEEKARIEAERKKDIEIAKQEMELAKKDAEEKLAQYEEAQKALDFVKQQIDKNSNESSGVTSNKSSNVENIKQVIKAINMLSTQINSMQTQLNNSTAAKIDRAKKASMEDEALAAQELASISKQLQNAENQVKNNLMPQLNATMVSLEQVVDNAGLLMEQMGGVLGGMDDVFASLDSTIDAGNRSLTDTRNTIKMLSDRLSNAIDKVEDAAEDEKVEVLMNTLSGDPDKYGEFFSEPVQINTEKIYPVENYGSAVTPFYTVLAIWVGALILTAILRVAPDASRYPEAKAYEKYFGRYATFFVFGQFQALIIVLGDLYVLHVQCLHPFYFWLAAALTSLTFSILIFSLVLAFGDVGKALAVVIVVLQIAGSSGTYPIELLPEFFQKLYIFFPFPYAINAMRESVAGMYGHDYLVYLIQLSIFIVVSLAVGLWIRKPFSKLNHFMEERMEETGIL
ncbi:MAG: YhgE/Pip domain-containing protein [Lachnospiraceae bacterium]|nr:YhgE/Pip domain-containing protein [Lachnospiraceae bacterium]